MLQRQPPQVREQLQAQDRAQCVTFSNSSAKEPMHQQQHYHQAHHAQLRNRSLKRNATDLDAQGRGGRFTQKYLNTKCKEPGALERARMQAVK